MSDLIFDHANSIRCRNLLVLEEALIPCIPYGVNANCEDRIGNLHMNLGGLILCQRGDNFHIGHMLGFPSQWIHVECTPSRTYTHTQTFRLGWGS